MQRVGPNVGSSILLSVATLLLVCTKEDQFCSVVKELFASGRAPEPKDGAAVLAACHEFETAGLVAPDVAPHGKGAPQVLPKDWHQAVKDTTPDGATNGDPDDWVGPDQEADVTLEEPYAEMERQLAIEKEKETVISRAHRLSVRRVARAPVDADPTQWAPAQPLVAQAPPTGSLPAPQTCGPLPPSRDGAVYKKRRVGSVDVPAGYPLELLHLCPPRRPSKPVTGELKSGDVAGGPDVTGSDQANVGVSRVSPLTVDDGGPRRLRDSSSSSLSGASSHDKVRRSPPTLTTCDDQSSEHGVGSSSIDLHSPVTTDVGSTSAFAPPMARMPPAAAVGDVPASVSPRTAFPTSEERERTRKRVAASVSAAQASVAAVLDRRHAT